jgi:hypothetical protein
LRRFNSAEMAWDVFNSPRSIATATAVKLAAIASAEARSLSASDLLSSNARWAPPNLPVGSGLVVGIS